MEGKRFGGRKRNPSAPLVFAAYHRIPELKDMLSTRNKTRLAAGPVQEWKMSNELSK
jgi:hypothetical protein